MKKIFILIITAIFLSLTIVPNINAFELANDAGNNYENIDVASVDVEKSSNCQGLVIMGPDGNGWEPWFGNAQDSFKHWCSTVNSGMFDSERISEYLQRPEVLYFYVIAHSDGKPFRFRVYDDFSWKTSYYTETMIDRAMAKRGPIKFALICCCEGMSYTDDGSLSYALRKGETTGTVTIGYTNMGECPNFGVTLEWQKELFYLMNEKWCTIKDAFDEACEKYPSVADYVRFAGDENLRFSDESLYKIEKSLNNPSLPLFNKLIMRLLERHPLLAQILKFY
jgi:hypothetical protein